MPAGNGWQRRFDDPIALPDGKQLKTLADAIAWLAKHVPKAEHESALVQTAARSRTKSMMASPALCAGASGRRRTAAACAARRRCAAKSAAACTAVRRGPAHQEETRTPAGTACSPGKR